MFRLSPTRLCSVVFLFGFLLVCSAPVSSAKAVGLLQLWSASPTIKVRPADPVVPTTGVTVKGAKRETVPFQIVLTSASAYTGLDVNLTAFSGPGGTTIPATNAQLYRVGYLNIQTISDPAGSPGLWPDSLYPIGKDRYYNEQRNGAPFALAANTNQAIWVSLDIPLTIPAGPYSAVFSVTQGTGGAVVQSIPVNLTVWNFTLPATSSAMTTYDFDAYSAYCYHFHTKADHCLPWNTIDNNTITDLYANEALAHRITLSTAHGGVPYTYNDATQTITDIDWSMWDPSFSLSGITSIPLPPLQFDWDDPSHYPWTPAEEREAIAFWKAVSVHYQVMGWYDRSFLYTLDEPGSDWPLNVYQSNLLHQADPGLRSMVTSQYTPNLATGHINIWTVIANDLDLDTNDNPVGFHTIYDNVRKDGTQVWWYDSTSSGDSDPVTFQQHGIWADEFVDHPGVNQLLHGFLTWKYHLDGYLYWDTNYSDELALNRGIDPWQTVYGFARNGDGSLFYPGKPAVIGGTTNIPVPSLRMELLRLSWDDFDYMTLLKNAGQGAFVDGIVNGLITNSYTWDHAAADYDTARDLFGSKLSALGATGTPTTVVFTTQPGASLSTQPVVLIENETGTAETSYNGPVSIALQPGNGTAGATLSGTTTLNAVNGVVAFTDLHIDQYGVGYVLHATAGNIAANSQPFSIYPAGSYVALQLRLDTGQTSTAQCVATLHLINVSGQVLPAGTPITFTMNGLTFSPKAVLADPQSLTGATWLKVSLRQARVALSSPLAVGAETTLMLKIGLTKTPGQTVQIKATLPLKIGAKHLTFSSNALSNLTSNGATQPLIVHGPHNGKTSPRTVVTIQGRFFANSEPLGVQISPSVVVIPQSIVSTRNGVAQLALKGLTSGTYTITFVGLESGVSGTAQVFLK